MKAFASLVVAGLLFAPNLARADAADKIYTPIVEKGEREIEYKAGYERPGPGTKTMVQVVGFGYGLTDWWASEIEFKYKREDPEKQQYDALEWENIFQLTETGKYPVDVGLLFEIERPRERTEGYEVKWGPLLQTEFGQWQLNGNVLWERNHRNDVPGPTKLLHQFQAKYRWTKELEFGLQSFGEVGQWNAWLPRPDREHRIGPALFGKLGLGAHRAIKYDLAFLVGTTPATPDKTLRLRLEYEF